MRRNNTKRDASICSIDDDELVSEATKMKYANPKSPDNPGLFKAIFS